MILWFFGLATCGILDLLPRFFSSLALGWLSIDCGSDYFFGALVSYVLQFFGLILAVVMSCLADDALRVP